MAADIFFDENLAWSVNSAGFIHMLRRVISKCRDDETVLIDLFSFATEMRCFNIDRYKDRGLRLAMTKQIHATAREYIEELRADPNAHQEEITSIEDLIDQSQKYLAKLGRENG